MEYNLIMSAVMSFYTSEYVRCFFEYERMNNSQFFDILKNNLQT